MTQPIMKVEIAFTTGPNDPSPVWVDVTQWLRASPGITITRGRQDQFGEVQPSKLNLTLDNSDGRFTAGNAASPYYPNVKKGRRIRVTATHAAVAYRRFTGYVDEWPVTWADASATVADAAISASSRQSRLGHGTELRSIIEEEYLLDSPDAYYTMGEPEASVAAGNNSQVTQPAMTFAGSGTAPVFGTATGPGTDDMTAVQFAAGKCLDVSFPAPVVTPSDTTYAFEFFFLSSITGFRYIGQFGSSSGDVVLVTTSASGKIQITASNSPTGTIFYDLPSAATVTDGNTHHLLIRHTISAGTLNATIYLDGAQILTASTALAAFSTIDHLSLGGIPPALGSSNMTGVIAHAAITAGTTEMTAARVLAHSDAGLNGFSGEGSDARIARLATYALVPSSEVSTETGLSTSITNQVTNGKTAFSLMSDVVNTEGGVLFDARDGTLTFHARSHRYNAASAMTLTSELQANLEPRLDDQGLVNDMTTNRENGVTARAVDTASISDYGLYRETLTLLTTSDNEVQDAANWKVNVGSTPQVRIPVGEANVAQASSAQTTSLLTREIGDRITLSGLPSQAPASSMDFFIEGYTETVQPFVYRMSFNLSPAELSGVWQLDSPVYSLLGTSTRLGY